MTSNQPRCRHESTCCKYGQCTESIHIQCTVSTVLYKIIISKCVRQETVRWSVCDGRVKDKKRERPATTAADHRLLRGCCQSSLARMLPESLPEKMLLKDLAYRPSNQECRLNTGPASSLARCSTGTPAFSGLRARRHLFSHRRRAGYCFDEPLSSRAPWQM